MLTVPECAYVAKPSEPLVIVAVKRGHKGYWATDLSPEAADRFNAELGVAPAMREAMGFASCFGWDRLLKDPDVVVASFAPATSLTVAAMSPLQFGAPVFHS
jgi:hypothetical protein